MEKGLVVIVDDDREILEVCSEVLMDQGFEVISFENPLEAIKALMGSRRVDVIITDFRMPEMNGLELMGKLNDQKIKIPAIMFTGVADKELAIKALNAGCHYLIEKPLRNQELIHYTEQAMVYGRWEGISDRLLQECTHLIKLLKELSSNYESRFNHAENIVYLNKSGSQVKPEEVQGYLKNISNGISIENEVQDSNKTMEALAKEHKMLKNMIRR